MNEPKIIEMYADGMEYGTVTREEVIEHCHQEVSDHGQEEWKSACGYFSRFTDGSGLCRLDLRELVREDVTDCDRTTAVCMMFSVLEYLGKITEIPRDLLLGWKPFLIERITELNFELMNLYRMDRFQKRAITELKETLENDGSLDECFDRLLAAAPSVTSYEVINREMKDKYLETFKVLRKAARSCSIPCYADALGDYVRALS